MKSRTIFAIGWLLITGLLAQPSSAQLPAQFVISPWKFLGPQPISNQSGGVSDCDGYAGPRPIAGRVSAVAVADAKTVYIGTSGGGIWKTTDGGNNWTPKTDLQRSLTIGALALDPTNKNVIYAGTGEFIPYTDEYNGVGILRSADAGETWKLLPDPNGVFKDNRVARLAVDPNNPNKLYVATAQGLAISADGGQTWSKKTLGGCSSITDVVVDDITTPSTVYAATSVGDFFTSADSSCQGIWKASTANDDFKQANGNLIFLIGGKAAVAGGPLPSAPKSFIRLAIEKYKEKSIDSKGQYLLTTNSVLYAAMNVSSQRSMSHLPPIGYDTSCGSWQPWATTSELRVFKSENGGYTWIPLPKSVEPNYGPFQIAVQRSGSTDAIYILSDELFLSRDGGNSWENISSDASYGWKARKVHHDMHGFDFVPFRADKFFLGTDGGVYKSEDYGQTYANLNATLGNAHFWRGAVSNEPNPVLIGSMHDSGFVLSTGVNKEWLRVQGSDGGSVVWDPVDPKRVYLTRAAEPLSVRRSTDGGQNFQNASSGLAETSETSFLPPLVMDPALHQRLFTASNRLYMTDNGADSWKDVGPPPFYASPNSGITALGITSGATETKVYVARENNVFKFTQKTPQAQNQPGPIIILWLNMTFNLGDFSFWRISSLAVDPTNPGIVYAGLEAPSGQAHLLKLVGNIWTDISKPVNIRAGNFYANLPDANVNAIVINPKSPEDIFVATSGGVYRSTNGGKQWFSIMFSMPKAMAMDIVLNQSATSLYVFTHGRGVWKADLKDLPTQP